MQLTIRFEHPFYVGILEQERDGRLYAARHVFGAEPNSETVYAFVLAEVDALCRRMTAGVALEAVKAPRRINPKRRQREIRRALEAPATSTKAQEALRLQLEANKTARQSDRRADRAAEQDRRWQLRQEKTRRKRRGR